MAKTTGLTPRFEVHELGPGYHATDIWDEDGDHESRGTVCNNERTFDSGVLATDETIEVTCGRLIVICLDYSDRQNEDAEPSHDLEPDDDSVVLHKGSRYRLVAVGLTQYHRVYGPEEEAEEEPAAEEPPPPPDASAAPAEDAPRTVPETPAASRSDTPSASAPSASPVPPPSRGGLGLPSVTRSSVPEGSGISVPPGSSADLAPRATGGEEGEDGSSA
ncbi:hypothetical protein HYW17_05815 [Candidatus Uhrbacteria bacterium]|nr:hypothetical protein [Candidatus Uhrbacteria bacterium]